MNAATLGDYGQPSSLGLRDGNFDALGGDFFVSMLFRGGTLQYTGANTQSTNRFIRLSTTGNGGTIDASGSIPERNGEPHRLHDFAKYVGKTANTCIGLTGATPATHNGVVDERPSQCNFIGHHQDWFGYVGDHHLQYQHWPTTVSAGILRLASGGTAVNVANPSFETYDSLANGNYGVAQRVLRGRLPTRVSASRAALI